MRAVAFSARPATRGECTAAQPVKKAGSAVKLVGATTTKQAYPRKLPCATSETGISTLGEKCDGLPSAAKPGLSPMSSTQAEQTPVAALLQKVQTLGHLPKRRKNPRTEEERSENNLADRLAKLRKAGQLKPGDEAVLQKMHAICVLSFTTFYVFVKVGHARAARGKFWL